jgi:hypothetical protein
MEQRRRTIMEHKGRTIIRLKHSLKADEEINTFLPDKLSEFDAAFATGELKKLASEIDGARDATADAPPAGPAASD